MYQYIGLRSRWDLDLTSKPKEITIPYIIGTFGLNSWSIHKEPNYKEDTDVVGNSFYLIRKNESNEGEGHNVIVNKYVTNRYNVLQYPDGLQYLNQFVEDGSVTIDSSLLIGYGEVLSVLCNINLDGQVANEHDRLERYILLVLTHDGSSAGLFFTDIRPVCSNTITLAKQKSLAQVNKAFQLRQDNPEESLKQAIALMDLAKRSFVEKQIPQYQAYNELVLEKEQTDHIIRSILNLPLLDLSEVTNAQMEKYYSIRSYLNEAPGQEYVKPNSAWQLLNAVTYYSQGTSAKDELKSRTNDLFGIGRKLRRHTIEHIEQLLPSKHIPVSTST